MLFAAAGDSNLPLFIHVFGAMLLVGTLFAVALTSLMGWSDGGTTGEAKGLKRVAYKTVLLGVFPAYLVMRVGAQWTASKKGLEDSEATWITIGFITSDIGALLVVVSMILSGIGLRKLRNGPSAKLNRAVGIIALLLIASYMVTIWAMSTKPA